MTAVSLHENTPKNSNNAGKELQITAYNLAPKQEFKPVDITWQSSVLKKLPCSFKIENCHPVNITRMSLTVPKTVITMKGDGNCYFRAISYALTGSQANHLKLQTFIVDWMNKHKEVIENNFGITYLNDSKMNELGVWATEVEILSTAAALQTDIMIYCNHGTSLKWLNYSGRTIGDAPTTLKCIYLQNVTGNHFDLVESVQ